MQSCAHPDDEISDLLAALRFRDGIACVCATRGEGGQNDIGRERGAALGTLRTAEREAAAARLDLALHWLGEGRHDAITDFGFSKSGDETLARWAGSGRSGASWRWCSGCGRTSSAPPCSTCRAARPPPGDDGAGA